jgi:hypothetical protein
MSLYHGEASAQSRSKRHVVPKLKIPYRRGFRGTVRIGSCRWAVDSFASSHGNGKAWAVEEDGYMKKETWPCARFFLPGSLKGSRWPTETRHIGTGHFDVRSVPCAPTKPLFRTQQSDHTHRRHSTRLEKRSRTLREREGHRVVAQRHRDSALTRSWLALAVFASIATGTGGRSTTSFQLGCASVRYARPPTCSRSSVYIRSVICVYVLTDIDSSVVGRTFPSPFPSFYRERLVLRPSSPAEWSSRSGMIWFVRGALRLPLVYEGGNVMWKHRSS